MSEETPLENGSLPTPSSRNLSVGLTVLFLTFSHCANNVRGCCLLLDDGEPCVCVQAISYSLLCRYFREAVLPADRELCADLAATADTRKKCELCGKPFPARSNRAKYCDRCAPYAARRNAAERKRRQRAKARCVTV